MFLNSNTTVAITARPAGSRDTTTPAILYASSFSSVLSMSIQSTGPRTPTTQPHRASACVEYM